VKQAELSTIFLEEQSEIITFEQH